MVLPCSIYDIVYTMLQYTCRLDYANSHSDAQGVTVTVAEFGSVSSVEFLHTVPYFYDFVEYFVGRGYTRDVNIRAAPYDWRLGAG